MFKFLNEKAEQLENRIGNTTRVDVRSLCVLRIVFGVFTILFCWPSYTWIGMVPGSFFYPPPLSVISLMSGFPPQLFFVLLDIGVIIATITLMIGLFTRWSTISLLVMLLVGNHFRYSFGKIDHDILHLSVLLVMTFKDWGRFFSLDALLRRETAGPEDVNGWTDLRLLGVFVAFGFFSSGFPKALNWIDLDLTTSGVLSWLYSGYFTLGRDKMLAGVALQVHDAWFWELADFGAVVFELGFVVALFWRRSWYVWLLIACVFHLINCLMLNIAFNIHAVVYLAFLPWSRLLPTARLGSTKLKLAILTLGIFGIAAGVIRLTNRTSYGILWSLMGWQRGGSEMLWASCGIHSVTFLLLFTCLSGKRKDRSRSSCRVRRADHLSGSSQDGPHGGPYMTSRSEDQA